MKRIGALWALLVVVGGAGTAHGQDQAPSRDWPQWRGPDRTGVSKETGLLDKWPEGGPRLLWTATGAGEGYSTVSSAKGLLFTMGNRGETEYVICYDAKTGKERWAQENGKAFHNGRGNGPRGTPTVDGNFVYVLGANGDVSCRDVRTGKARWHLNVIRDLGGKNIGWGLSESVLIEGNKLICTPGGRGSSVVALDKKTGQLIWKSGRDRAGYSSPIAVDVGRTRQIIVFTASTARGMSADDGKELWTYDAANNGTANVATPIFHDNHVFFSSGYGTGGGVVKLTPSRSGTAAEQVWFENRMQNHHCSSVLVDGYLYGFGGSNLMCMNFKTGEIAWRDRSVGKGSLVYADGHLYCFSDAGTVGLVKATPDAYHEVSRFKIEKGRRPTWAHPVVAGGKLFLREQDKIYCFDVAKK